MQINHVWFQLPPQSRELLRIEVSNLQDGGWPSLVIEPVKYWAVTAILVINVVVFRLDAVTVNLVVSVPCGISKKSEGILEVFGSHLMMMNW